jgi:hypothetical protein
MQSEKSCSVAGVVLSAYLQGLSVTLLPNEPKGSLLVLDCTKVNYIGEIAAIDVWKHEIKDDFIGSYDWVRAFYDDDDIFLHW